MDISSSESSNEEDETAYEEGELKIFIAVLSSWSPHKNHIIALERFGHDDAAPHVARLCILHGMAGLLPNYISICCSLNVDW